MLQRWCRSEKPYPSWTSHSLIVEPTQCLSRHWVTDSVFGRDNLIMKTKTVEIFRCDTTFSQNLQKSAEKLGMDKSSLIRFAVIHTLRMIKSDQIKVVVS
jgi:hypothetical protein